VKQLSYQAQETAGSSGVVRSPRLLLTVEEAADRISICRSTMFKLIRQGDVKSVKVGRLRRVTPSALEDYVRQLSAPVDSAALCLGPRPAVSPISA
jgi:excisionase family DNA binding protein